MSLDSNLYEKSIKILSDLISFKTISGKENGPLIDYCDDILKKNGVSTFRVFDDNKERVNLFGTIKAKKTNRKKPIRSVKILIDFSYKLLSKLINLIIYYYYERTNNLRYI